MFFRAVSVCIAIIVTIPLIAGTNSNDYRPEFRIPTDPTITVHYGLSELSLDEFEYPFGSPGMIGLHLGFSRIDRLNDEARIINFMSRYVSVDYISTGLGEGAGTGEFASAVWRFGLAGDNGYGYRLSSSSSMPSLILSHGNGLTWSQVDFDRPETLTPDEFRTDRFESGLRFGSMTEAGLMFQISNTLTLNASFERSIVYERHLFWKSLGSKIIESAVQRIVDRFVDRIFESSPAAGPVVNFLLKNGLAYGIYELRRSDMNWPFDTAPPLHHDSFKFGVTFIL